MLPRFLGSAKRQADHYPMDRTVSLQYNRPDLLPSGTMVSSGPSRTFVRDGIASDLLIGSLASNRNPRGSNLEVLLSECCQRVTPPRLRLPYDPADP
jgi:hypothetical protein